MAGIELRDYSGDFEDLAELVRHALMPDYGQIWAALPDASFLRWQLSASSGGRYLAAYDGSQLVGGCFSIPHKLRVGSSVVPIALIGALMTHQKHRRWALPIVEHMRRRHEEEGIAFGLGVVAGDPTSMSYRFWTRYGQTFPQNMRYLFQSRSWAKMLAPRHLAGAGVNAWERVAGRTLAPLLGFVPSGRDPHVRPYRPEDLEQCMQVLDRSTADCDWSLVWQPDRLMHRLESPVSGTLVFERAGRIHGLVNYHCILLVGRYPVSAAVIALWAAQELTGVQRIRLIGHLCNHLRKQDVHLVLAPGTVPIPTAALTANLFFPIPGQFTVAALPTRHQGELTPPKSCSLIVM